MTQENIIQGPETEKETIRREIIDRAHKQRAEEEELTRNQLADRSLAVPIIDDKQTHPEHKDLSTDYSGQRELERLKLAGESAESGVSNVDSE
jgi:hypothetical protein